MKRTVAMTAVLLFAENAWSQDRIGEVQEIAPGVYFHQGDIEKGHCNQGWVMFESFVLVIDGNYPSGAEIVVNRSARFRQADPIRLRYASPRRP